MAAIVVLASCSSSGDDATTEATGSTAATSAAGAGTSEVCAEIAKDAAADAPAPEKSADGSEVTLTDQTGARVTIPTSPSNVLGTYTADLDIIKSLGLTANANQGIREGDEGFPKFFPQDWTEGLKPFANYPEVNYEQIAAANPGLILNSYGGGDSNDVSRFAEIAPIYSYRGSGGDWRIAFKQLGDALNKGSEADAVLKEITDATQAVKDAAGDKQVTIAIGGADADGFNWVAGEANQSLATLIRCDLGWKVPEIATEAFNELSRELIPDLDDADVVLLTDYDDPAAAVERVKADPQWSTLPAVKEGRVFGFDGNLSYGSPTAHKLLLESFQQVADSLA